MCSLVCLLDPACLLLLCAGIGIMSSRAGDMSGALAPRAATVMTQPSSRRHRPQGLPGAGKQQLWIRSTTWSGR